MNKREANGEREMLKELASNEMDIIYSKSSMYW